MTFADATAGAPISQAMAARSERPTGKPTRLRVQVRNGEHGALVVYADRIRCTETADKSDEIEHEIPFLKAHTVLNGEQIDNLPEHFYAKSSPPLPAPARVETPERFAAATRATSAMAATGLSTASKPTSGICLPSRDLQMPRAITRPRCTS
jgi:hypothetical protein